MLKAFLSFLYPAQLQTTHLMKSWYKITSVSHNFESGCTVKTCWWWQHSLFRLLLSTALLGHSKSLFECSRSIKSACYTCCISSWNCLAGISHVIYWMWQAGDLTHISRCWQSLEMELSHPITSTVSTRSNQNLRVYILILNVELKLQESILGTLGQCWREHRVRGGTSFRLWL
jgi:hypothetical protein